MNATGSAAANTSQTGRGVGLFPAPHWHGVVAPIIISSPWPYVDDTPTPQMRRPAPNAVDAACASIDKWLILKFYRTPGGQGMLASE
jgi:hypothetical protein